MSDRLIKLIITFFHVGEMRPAPGTWGSVAGLLIYMIVQSAFLLYAAVFFCLVLLGLILAGEAERIFGRKDPPSVVIDEVAGMLLACFLLPPDPAALAAAFLLFRLFDIVKPYPVGALEKAAGGVGIMMDDIMAGIYANLVMHVAMWCLKIV